MDRIFFIIFMMNVMPYSYASSEQSCYDLVKKGLMVQLKHDLFVAKGPGIRSVELVDAILKISFDKDTDVLHQKQKASMYEVIQKIEVSYDGLKKVSNENELHQWIGSYIKDVIPVRKAYIEDSKKFEAYSCAKIGITNPTDIKNVRACAEDLISGYMNETSRK